MIPIVLSFMPLSRFQAAEVTLPSGVLQARGSG
jgi:hypothetical protein